MRFQGGEPQSGSNEIGSRMECEQTATRTPSHWPRMHAIKKSSVLLMTKIPIRIPFNGYSHGIYTLRMIGGSRVQWFSKETSGSGT